MKKNMVVADRLLRIAAAGVMIGLVLTNTVTGIIALLMVVMAIVFLATSSFGYCPMYTLFGKKKEG